MKTYPPFQVITADNGQHVNEALNLAVYAALKKHGLNLAGTDAYSDFTDKRRFTNACNHESVGKDYLMYDDRNVRTDILTFDARTQMGPLCEFLDNPPKLKVSTTITGAYTQKPYPVEITKSHVEISGFSYTHASILALAKAVEEFNA